MTLLQIFIDGLEIFPRRQAPTGCVLRLSIRSTRASISVSSMSSAARDLINSLPNLLLEPLVLGQKPGNSLLHEVVSAMSGPDGQFVELNFLPLWQMHFHKSPS